MEMMFMLQAEIETQIINKNQGIEIYGFIKNNPALSPAQIINLEGVNYLYSSIKMIKKEIDRVVRELREFKNGKLLQAEVSHFTEEGEKVIDSEAVYYEYTTDEDLAAQVSSDYLDVMTIIEDVLNR
jgi:hypothetical protein